MLDRQIKSWCTVHWISQLTGFLNWLSKLTGVYRTSWLIRQETHLTTLNHHHQIVVGQSFGSLRPTAQSQAVLVGPFLNRVYFSNFYGSTKISLGTPRTFNAHSGPRILRSLVLAAESGIPPWNLNWHKKTALRSSKIQNASCIGMRPVAHNSCPVVVVQFAAAQKLEGGVKVTKTASEAY